MLISPAFAQTGASGDGMGFATFVPLILIFVVFYFLLIRPQQKKMKEHREMVKALRRGDKIVTAGGIIGTISKVPEGDEVEVEVSAGDDGQSGTLHYPAGHEQARAGGQ